MGKNQYKCQWCNRDYWSYKPNSQFCSMDCKKQYRQQFQYNCDYCGVQFRVKPFQLRDLETGKHKHLYCSRECADKGQVTSVTLNCLHCGKEFTVFNCVKDASKFCSQDCYREYKLAHSTAVIKVCPMCGKTFTTYHHSQVYCSKVCSGLKNQNRVDCICDHCGKPFQKVLNQHHPNGKNYCSNECRMIDQSWSPEELDILVEKYDGKESCEEISNLTNGRWSAEAVYRKAIILGLTQSRLWSEEDKEIVRKYYPTCSYEELQAMLPHKTESSIRGVAHQLGLKSYFYLSSVYTDEEDEFLRANYKIKTNEELADMLGRTPSAIGQRLLKIGLKRESESLSQKYRGISRYLRGRIQPLINDLKSAPDAHCALSGNKKQLVFHHIRGFSLLVNEAMQNINFPEYENFTDYSDEELIALSDEFLKLHEQYSSYVLITKNIHMRFHKLYGYGCNTEAQWEEFLKLYQSK